MTNQEIFDTVSKHLLTQNAKSESVTGGCMYRGKHDRKCALGILIPDDKYNPKIECSYVGSTGCMGYSAHSLEMCLESVGLIKEHYPLLAALQCCHDGFDVKEWPQQLQNIAKRFDLKYDH